MDQEQKPILDYHQPTESAFWRRFRPIYAVLERHWLLPWKIVAVLMLIFIPTRIISYRADENHRNTTLKQVEIQNQKNEIVVLKIQSLLKNLPEDKSPSEYLSERLNAGQPLQKTGDVSVPKNADSFANSDELEWTDPDCGSVRMRINSMGQFQVVSPKSAMPSINASHPFSFWIWLHEAYEDTQEECRALITLVFCIVAVIWIAAFVFRTDEQRLKSGLHLFFLSLTVSALVFLPNNYRTAYTGLAPRMCVLAICSSGLACSFFLPRKGLLKYRGVWIGIFVVGLLILLGEWLLMRNTAPGQIVVFKTTTYLMNADEVDHDIPPSIRQSAMMPGPRAGDVSNRQESSPPMTAEVDNTAFSDLIYERMSTKGYSGNQPNSLLFRPNQWIECGGETYYFPRSVAPKASQLNGQGVFHNNIKFKSTSNPRLRSDSLLIYCQDGKLITLSPTNWEGDLPKDGRKRVFIYDVSAGEGERKYFVVVYEVIINGK